MAFEVGSAVRIEMTKWGDHPHWHFPTRWLGSDEHGDWLGIPVGSRLVRPGMEVLTEADQVALVPEGSSDVERAFMATFHAPGPWARVYVDMATPPTWDGAVVRAVDLDLDVILRSDGDLVVDDEDEFAEHQVTLGYPPEIVVLAEASRDRVHAAIQAGHPPYDGTHEEWLHALAGLQR